MGNREADPGLTRYISRVDRYPKLTREEELGLAERWLEGGDPAAADLLIRAHMRYVVAIAVRYRRYGVPLGELIAEGNFGIVHALTKFEPKRGNRFVTYAAYWIRAYVLSHVMRSWSLVGGGSGALRSKLFFKLRRERTRIMSLIGDSERADEILAEKFGTTPEQISMMLRRLETRDLSLDSTVFDGTATTLVDTMISPGEDQETSLAKGQNRDELKLAVTTAVQTLDPRERFIVEKRMLADPEDELTLAEIGRRLGVSRERARQLEARAKQKLRDDISRTRAGKTDDHAS